MHNLLRFYNEFSSLASASGEPIEAKTLASSLGLNINDMDVEITLRSIPKPVNPICDGDLVLFFYYDKNNGGHAEEDFYLAKISIPSGAKISKSRFTAKKIHIKTGSCLKINREYPYCAEILDNAITASAERKVIVVRKCNEEEMATYKNVFALKLLENSIKEQKNFSW